jgi:predicted TIM-barrel fold metal-dependent hydrolase
MLKLDIFNHIFPKSFFDRMLEVAGNVKDLGKRSRSVPMLVDLDARFRVMDRFGADYKQILSLAAPPLEAMGGPNVAIDLAKRANDGMAELVAKYPDRFPAFIASLPMNDAEASVAEMHRAMRDLKACGIQIFSNAAGKPLDLPEFQPLFDGMAAYDRPVWLHPARGATFPDYPGEKTSKYEIWWTFGWPYETSVAMARLVFSGLFDRLPDIKIITHHLGGMIPYFEGRVGPGWDQLGARTSDEDLTLVLKRLKKRPLDYFKMFYADTAVFGSDAATRCGLDFFGAERVVFASDSPFDPEQGPMYIRETIRIIDSLEISENDRALIYWKNAVRLLHLDV